MEVILAPLAAVFISIGFTSYSNRKLSQGITALQDRIEVLEDSDPGPEITKKVVTMMVPVVEAVKTLQDTVGVRS
jgi:hypothetical protein